MKIKDDDITDFCCSEFEDHMKRPEKMIMVLPYKQYQNSVEQWRAQMFILPSGISSSFIGEQGVAGCGMKPIDFCPWCSEPVKIEIT
jgi:hypothetical protein